MMNENKREAWSYVTESVLFVLDVSQTPEVCISEVQLRIGTTDLGFTRKRNHDQEILASVDMVAINR